MTTEPTAERYRRLATLFGTTVAALDDQDWDRPSPCEEWTARDVLAHVLDTEADIVTRVGLSIERTVDVDADPVAAWDEVRAAMQAVLDDPARAELGFESLGHQTTLAASIDRFICFDLIVHRWDIATAAGHDVTIAAEDLAAANAFLDTMGSMFYDYGASAPAVPVPDDASPQDALIARAGREPHWSSS